jgi:hypothetical protein
MLFSFFFYKDIEYEVIPRVKTTNPEPCKSKVRDRLYH